MSKDLKFMIWCLAALALAAHVFLAVNSLNINELRARIVVLENRQ